MALGAFLAGMVVGRSDFSLRAASEALPMRDAFAVLFFVSVGMLFDPAFAARRARRWCSARWRSSWSASRWSALRDRAGCCGYPFRTALAVAVALAQIGEFSFILATLGRDLGVLTRRGDQRARRRRRSSRSCSTRSLYRAIRSDRAVGGGAAAAVRAARIGRAVIAGRCADGRAATRAHDPRTARSSSATARSAGRVVRLLRENGIEPTVDRAEHGHGARAARGRASTRSTATRRGRRRSRPRASRRPAA